MLIVATLAILGAVGGALYALVLDSASVSHKISQPSVSFADMKTEKATLKNLQADDTESAKELPQKQEEEVQDEDAIPPELLPVLNEIEASIANFAKKTKQPAPKERLRINIYKAANSYVNFFSAETILAKLQSEAKLLESDSERFANMTKSDVEYIGWYDFLSYFFDKFGIEIEGQIEKIQAEEARVAEGKIKAKLLYAYAAGSFGAFILVTIILLLFSIDRNIYNMQQQANKEPLATEETQSAT